MSYSPLISILLPVYNGERTLKATLESLLTQTYPHFELLIGIDGTKDGSKTIAEDFADERIKIIEQPHNLGLASNVNSLIAASSPESDFFAMAEQDDVYVPERLEWQVAVMEQHPEVGLVSGIAEFIGDGGSILFPGILVYGHPFPQGETLFEYLYINQLKVVNTCMLWRKAIHQTHKLDFKNTYGNFNTDWDFVLRFALKSEVYGIPKVLVRMNRKKQNKSVTTNKVAQHKASRQLLKDFKKEFPQLVDSKLYNEALKMHRKVEIGHHSKLEVLSYGLYYFTRYRDIYFLKYLNLRFKKYWY